MNKIGLLLLFLSVMNSTFGAEKITGKVVAVLDGNTFEMLAEDNDIYRILLYGIDCPESGQPFAEEAKKELEKLILKQKITVDIQGKNRLGVRMGVVVSRDDPRELLLRNGLAWTSENNPQSDLERLRLEAEAKKTGIWAETNPVPPWIFRREQSMLQPKMSE